MREGREDEGGKREDEGGKREKRKRRREMRNEDEGGEREKREETENGAGGDGEWKEGGEERGGSGCKIVESFSVPVAFTPYINTHTPLTPNYNKAMSHSFCITLHHHETTCMTFSLSHCY